MMSLEATNPSAVSVNHLSKSQAQLSPDSVQHPPQHSHRKPSVSNSKHSSDRSADSSKLRKRASKTSRSARSSQNSHSSSEQRTQRLHRPSVCHSLVERILHTVGELENTLFEDHQHDYKLHMALEQQTEKIDLLRCSLENEKERNQRLVQLIRGVDSGSSTGDEGDHIFNTYRLSRDGGSRHDGPWQSRSSMDAFESISPLLMQQRYDELTMSHKQCQRQLAKKDKLLTLTKCGKEELQARYDHLLDEYRNVQKRFEDMCCRYLRLQAKKNHELQKLKNALTYASDCVVSAQSALDCRTDGPNAKHYDMEFRQNLQSFIKALRLCEWVQHGCSSSAGSK